MQLDLKDKALLRDMRKAALEAKSFVSKTSEAAYLRSVLTQRACERSLEIIGEAAGRLSKNATGLYPGVPFSDIVGMRNFIAHGYNKVDPTEVWRTLKRSIPALLQALDQGPTLD